MTLRPLADTVGFPHTASQLEAIIERIGAPDSNANERWRLAIAPHDDYCYVGGLYPAVLKNVAARRVILFGVAHKARQLGIENELVFDTFTHWHGPYGDIAVSPARDRIVSLLPPDIYRIDDTMQTVEHSIEALLPFLQHYRRDVEIVPILVPAMPFERMQDLAEKLADVIAVVARDNAWQWGNDFALVISNDAVHYGDEEWGGRDFARFGTDEAGYRQALELEQRIIDDTLLGRLTPERIRAFNGYTVRPDDFREYLWTWCGRYSVPFGLLTGWYIEQRTGDAPLFGELVGYGTSIDGRPHIAVDDLGMGVTAPAHRRHWVGYASVGYR